jgi:hypothetical protein
MNDKFIEIDKKIIDSNLKKQLYSIKHREIENLKF